MSIVNRLVIASIGLVVVGVGVGVFMNLSESAHKSNAAGDLANIADSQEWSIANEGRFATSLEEMTSVDFPLAGQVPSPSFGSKLSYRVNAEGTHYVTAATLPKGEVLVGSDTLGRGNFVQCKAYTSVCVAKVTDDSALIDATPTWTKF